MWSTLRHQQAGPQEGHAPVDDRLTSRLQKTTYEMEIIFKYRRTLSLGRRDDRPPQALVLSMTLNCFGNVASFSVTSQ